MRNVHKGSGKEKFAPRPLNPLSKPPSRRIHGDSNELCVTVWKSPPNWNVTVSLSPAESVGGE
jgi:hypothetical protein